MWSPSPALGDPDGNQVLGDATLALWNPDDRPLRFDICDYLPRSRSTDAKDAQAKVVVTGAKGKTIFDKVIPVVHHHDGARKPRELPATGKGVANLSVSGVERWFFYTYPATPLVWTGQKTDDGFVRFNMEIGTVRHWYFFVPAGTQSFDVRAACEFDNDVAHIEVNAPDRTMAIIYGRQGQATVKVPEGLDGRIWHLRTDIGSASRIVTAMPTDTMRYLGIHLTLDLKGVPGYLAPTWEQWFDPGKQGP